jgi:hypothetical protein
MPNDIGFKESINKVSLPANNCQPLEMIVFTHVFQAGVTEQAVYDII